MCSNRQDQEDLEVPTLLTHSSQVLLEPGRRDQRTRAPRGPPAVSDESALPPAPQQSQLPSTGGDVEMWVFFFSFEFCPVLRSYMTYRKTAAAPTRQSGFASPFLQPDGEICGQEQPLQSRQ